MSEANKALVRSVMESNDLAVWEEHPGLHELIPNMKMMMQAGEVLEQTVYEQIAEGNWVATRITFKVKMLTDGMGASAGDIFTDEVLMHHRIEDGVIVEQHSQGGRIG